MQNENVLYFLLKMLLSDVFQRLVIETAKNAAPESKHGRKMSDDDALVHIFMLLRTGMQWRELAANVHYTTVLRRKIGMGAPAWVRTTLTAGVKP